MNKELLPCPFCGSDDLCHNSWSIVNDTETEAVECNKCHAGAPMDIWNKGAHEWTNLPTINDYIDESELTG